MEIEATATAEGMAYKVTMSYRIDLEHNRIIWNGVVIPFKVINEDFIQVGNALIHRSVLEVKDGNIGRFELGG